MRTRIILTTFAMLLGVIAASFVSPATRISANNDKFRRSERPIPNRYIVVLNDTDENGKEAKASDQAAEHARGFSMRLEKVYESSIKGYSAEMSEAEALRLSDNPRIKFVEEDSEVDPQSSQSNATWGISRIDQRAGTLPSDTTYDYSATGLGVTAFVIDTGVWTENPDFNGRAETGFEALRDSQPITECNGHGTHVAGIVGSSTYGIAKNVRIVSVKVFPCWGAASVSDVISGIDWVSRNLSGPSVANMSFSGTRSTALEDSVRSLIGRGVTVTVAAGNNGDDACSYSPSHLAEAITVGSTYYTDERPSSTNYGSCLDVFAPGVAITSTWNQPSMPVNTISGTSMASPHVAGVAALFLERNPSASPLEVANAITQNATVDSVFNAGTGSPNRFLYSGFLLGGDPPPTQEPKPTPDPDACTGTQFGGTLVAGGSTNYQSSMNGFSGGSGSYSGRLTLPSGNTFVLSLEQKKGRSWTVVASSPGTSETELISFKGKSGTYRWRVRSVYGVGDYQLCSVTP